ncbi:hypothetical protein DFP72DRAFT_906744 [Ephemerocybe angulata]|uniref:Uncharacterized protein n=1 Tax=Ephemerocybe angulata TaxID=980116 RepID=A0A8H6M485_9AGAR|nr:hypothetical protein DFP72DRAFT_906744 [Tulosesus angulatus]
MTPYTGPSFWSHFCDVISFLPVSIKASTIADLVAKYGSSSTTAWLEFARYHIWVGEPIPESEFPPYGWIFAWALGPTARAFVKFAEQNGLHPVFACRFLGEELGWRTVSCIYEDYVDPAHLLELTSPDAKGQEGQHVVKDLKKNLMRAEKYHVEIAEVKNTEWTSEDKKAEWKASRSGIQIASTTLQPWLDQEHRRYWLARVEGKIVGILILTPGTSEALIFNSLKTLHEEHASGSHPSPSTPVNWKPPTSPRSIGNVLPVSTSDVSGISTANTTASPVTFGISASPELHPSLSKTYKHVASSCQADKPWRIQGEYILPVCSTTHVLICNLLVQRKFDSDHKPMYVCYP